MVSEPSRRQQDSRYCSASRLWGGARPVTGAVSPAERAAGLQGKIFDHGKRAELGSREKKAIKSHSENIPKKLFSRSSQALPKRKGRAGSAAQWLRRKNQIAQAFSLSVLAALAGRARFSVRAGLSSGAGAS